MPNLTNDFSRYRQKMLEQVMDFELQTQQKVIGLFTEFPAVGDGHYAIAIIEEQDNLYWQYRQWLIPRGMQVVIEGLYNLDTINIITLRHTLNIKQKVTWQQHLQHLQQQKLPATIHDASRIVLDGYHWQLKINTPQLQFDYSWQLANKHLRIFQPLIDWMNQPKAI